MSKTSTRLCDRAQERKSSHPLTRRRLLGNAAFGAFGVSISGLWPLSALAGAQDSFDLARLVASISGRVVTRDQADYEEWRQAMVWQMRKPRRYPQVIVQPQSVGEVVEIIRYASNAGHKVAVRTGGCNHGANFLRDGGILVDMSAFRRVSVDMNDGTVDVEPAVTMYKLTRELAKHDLVFPVATGPNVHLGGFLLGGGHGVNEGAWGGTPCLSVLEADVVTANGEVLNVSPAKHPDLFWALRGAGNGFPGIVTRFKLKTYARPSHIGHCAYVYSADRAVEVASWVSELVEQRLRNTDLRINLLHRVPSTHQGSLQPSALCSLRVMTYARSDSEARDVLGLLASERMTAYALESHEFQYTDVETLFFTGSAGSNRDLGLGRWGVDHIWSDMPAQALAAVMPYFLKEPASNVTAAFTSESTSVQAGQGAFSTKGRAYMPVSVRCYAESDDMRRLAWLSDAVSAMEPFSCGGYINMVNAQRPEAVRRCFSPEAWKRLRTIREAYDSNGVFFDFFGLA